jgi:serine/threonine protein kinase
VSSVPAHSEGAPGAHRAAIRRGTRLAKARVVFGDAYDDHSDPRWIAPWLEARAYLGGGATSRVYDGYDHRAAREVAIKVARAGLDARTLQRLQREVTALEAVHHDNVVGVLGHGLLEDGRPYVVMQRVWGEPLHDVLAKKPRLRMPWQDAVPLAIALLDALGAVHRAGIVHRDVKPANVLVSPHRGPILVDLGFAHLGDAGPRLTPDGRVVGTPGFIPPELLLGTSGVTPSADVYAMGVMLFQMLVGAAPFSGALSEMIQTIMTGPRPDVLAYVPDVPRAIATTVRLALSRDPTKRYADGDAMAAALRAALASLEPAAL